jgi:type VI secretion system protein ImpC
VNRFIAGIVGSEIVPAKDPQADQLVSSVDAATGDLMRAILHHPDFQALEAAWAGLRFLIGNLETDEELEVRVLDASREELAADLAAAGTDLESSALYRILAEDPGGPDARPWSMVALDFSFDPKDLPVLASMAAVASVAGAPILAGAGKDLDTSPHWDALRQSPFASYVGLAAHRILLRLPYGRNLDETERFEFEEMPGQSEHDSYLWGQPGMPLAFLLGKAYKARGWSMEPGDERQIGDLPQHTYEVDGEKVMKACAGEFLSERAAEEVLARGTMPIMSYKHQPMVQVLRFQSIGGGPLAGPWA